MNNATTNITGQATSTDLDPAKLESLRVLATAVANGATVLGKTPAWDQEEARTVLALIAQAQQASQPQAADIRAAAASEPENESSALRFCEDVLAGIATRLGVAPGDELPTTASRILDALDGSQAPADWQELAMFAWDSHSANLKLEHNTYQNQNFFFDGFKAAAGIPLLSEDAMQLVRDARAEGKASADSSDAVRRLRAAFLVNMLRAFPDKTHEEVGAEIARAIGAQESESMAGRPTWADVQARERDIRTLQSTVIELRQALEVKAGGQSVAPLSADLMRALGDARDLAMRNTVAARIPECGDFGAIAQNLDWAVEEIKRTASSMQAAGFKLVPVEPTPEMVAAGVFHPDMFPDEKFAAIRDAIKAAPTLAAAEHWTCFHCNESFTDRAVAAVHFGRTERQEPMCRVSQQQYREMEQRMEAYNAEDADIHRQMHAMENRHQAALRRAEEEGYARGLRDAIRFPQDAVPSSEATARAKCQVCNDTRAVYTGPVGDPPAECEACFDQEPAAGLLSPAEVERVVRNVQQDIDNRETAARAAIAQWDALPDVKMPQVLAKAEPAPADWGTRAQAALDAVVGEKDQRNLLVLAGRMEQLLREALSATKQFAPAGATELVAAIRDRVVRIRYIDESSRKLLIAAADMLEGAAPPAVPAD